MKSVFQLMRQSESVCGIVVRQNSFSAMSRLTVCLLLVLITGSSLAEAGNDEQSEKAADKVDDTGSGLGQVEGKQLGDLAAEDKAEDENLKQKDVKVDDPRTEDEQVEDKEPNDEAIGDRVVEEDVKEDPGEDDTKPVENCQKTHSKRPKHKGMKGANANKPNHTQMTKPANNDDDYDDDDTEYDNSKEDESDEDVGEEVLTRASCMDGLPLPQLSSLCCHPQMFLDDDLNECLKREQSKAIKSRNQKRRMRALLDIVGCVFRRKKYIKSGRTDRLNMKRIQADAEKLNDPERAEFMVDMYRSCGSIAKGAVKNFREKGRQVKTDFRSTHEVFQFVLYVCVDNYVQQQACPYFHWFGMSPSGEAKCAAYARECKQLVGQ